MEKSNLKSNVSSVAFAVTNLSGTDMNYDSGANEASNATTVFKDGGGGDLLADGDSITDTNSPTDIMDLISKYAFGDVGGGEEKGE